MTTMADPETQEEFNPLNDGAPRESHRSYATVPQPDGSQAEVEPLATSPTTQSSSGSIFGRFSFGRAKGVKDMAAKDLERLRRTEAAEQKQKRKASKERKKRHKEHKAERQAKEKKVNDFYGIRGFDPNAGMRNLNQERDSDGHGDETPSTNQSAREPLDPNPCTGKTWGVEYGKPTHYRGKGHYSGRHGNCGEDYGSRAAANDHISRG